MLLAQGVTVAESVEECEPLAHEEGVTEGEGVSVAVAQGVGEREPQEEALGVGELEGLGSSRVGVGVTLLLPLPVSDRPLLAVDNGEAEGEGEALVLALDVAPRGLCDPAALPLPVVLGQEVGLREGVAEVQGVALGVTLALALLHPVGEALWERLAESVRGAVGVPAGPLGERVVVVEAETESVTEALEEGVAPARLRVV